jgi:hypothetical protein
LPDLGGRRNLQHNRGGIVMAEIPGAVVGAGRPIPGSARAVEEEYAPETVSKGWTHLIIGVVGSWTRILPWFCLLFVASTSAYALQFAGAAMVPATAVDQFDLTKRRGPVLQQASTTSTHKLLITGLDATTGHRVNVECVTTTDRIAINTLLVELKNIGDIAL